MNHTRSKWLLALFMCPAAFAQDSTGVSITVEEPPLLANASVNELASITISETTPTGLRDGYFRLSTRLTPDFFVEYLASTSGSGSLGPEGVRLVPQNVAVGGFSNMILVHVDADDSRLDSITLSPVAFFETNPVTPGGLALQMFDGDGSGNETGVGSAQLRVGYFDDIIDLGVPRFTLVEVGETYTVDISPTLEGVEGPYRAITNDPAVVAVEMIDDDTLDRPCGMRPRGTASSAVPADACEKSESGIGGTRF